MILGELQIYDYVQCCRELQDACGYLPKNKKVVRP